MARGRAGDRLVERAARPVMTVVGLIGVEKSFGSWPVLQGADLEVGEGARIGIVGPNGAGKSTMLKILAGLETANAGEVVRRKGLVAAYLEQNPDGDARTPAETVLAARPDVAALDGELRAVEAELARPDVMADLAKMDRVLTRQQDLLDRWVAAGGPGLEGEVDALLRSLGFEVARPRAPDHRALRWTAQARRARRLPDPSAAPAPARRAGDPPRCRPAGAARRARRGVPGRRGHGLARPLPPGRDRLPDRRARPWRHHDVARELQRVRRGEGGGAEATGAGLRHAAEGDRAPRGRHQDGSSSGRASW